LLRLRQRYCPVPKGLAVVAAESVRLAEVLVPEAVGPVPEFAMPVGSSIAEVPVPVGHRPVPVGHRPMPVARRPGPDSTHTDSGSNTVADSSTGGNSTEVAGRLDQRQFQSEFQC
jgi:hypothetical protein